MVETGIEAELGGDVAALFRPAGDADDAAALDLADLADDAADRTGRGGDRRAGRRDVVHEGDTQAAKRAGHGDEGAAHVLRALPPIQLHLRPCPTDAAERHAQRQPARACHLVGQEPRLVVAALPGALDVQHDGHDRVVIEEPEG